MGLRALLEHLGSRFRHLVLVGHQTTWFMVEHAMRAAEPLALSENKWGQGEWRFSQVCSVTRLLQRQHEPGCFDLVRPLHLLRHTAYLKNTAADSCEGIDHCFFFPVSCPSPPSLFFVFLLSLLCCALACVSSQPTSTSTCWWAVPTTKRAVP